MTINYTAYIHSGEWQTKRVRLLRKWKAGCAACGSGAMLDIHHKTYERLGHELPTDLVPLCRLCHDEVHRRHRLASTWMTLEVVTDRYVGKLSPPRPSPQELRVLKRAAKRDRRRLRKNHLGQHKQCAKCHPVEIA